MSTSNVDFISIPKNPPNTAELINIDGLLGIYSVLQDLHAP
nr:hypothetical protein [Ningiella ruwaisensis]